jgi:cell division septation protein DedD
MARDYKHRKRRRSNGGGHGFAAGLACGLGVALIVHLYHLGQGELDEAPARAAMPAPARVAPEPVVEEEDRFEFYEILPEFEVPVPELPAKGDSGAPVRALPPGSYYLQAGSFRTHADADRRKATLALLGVTSAIQRVSIDGDQTWFRVRVGPIREPSELDALRRRLESEDIQTLAVRAVEGP